MKIGFIIYEGMTALDFIGMYDPITRLKTMDFIPDLEWDICAIAPQVKDQNGLTFIPTKVNPLLAEYDAIAVPGGINANLDRLIATSNFIQWLKTAQDCHLKISVCTGSLLLGEAGFLTGKKATTHPNSLTKLKKYTNDVLDHRIVDEGDLITARGVTSSIDLGLYICEKLVGTETKEKIRERMDYQTDI